MLLNKNRIRSVGSLGALMVFAATSNAVPLPPQKSSKEANAIEQGRRLLANRSARFVENKGQWDSQARFLAQSRNLNLWYTDQGIRYDQLSGDRRRHQAIDMTFVGGGSSRPVGVSKLNAEAQYFHGSVAVTGIGSFHEVLKRNVLPGVNLRGYFDGGKPRYDLIVAPGVNPSKIALGFKGSNGLSVQKGALKIGTNFGGIFNGKPVAYQVVNGKQVPVAASWTVAQNTARFKLGAYDAKRPLVIDPLVYGTYFGGLQGPDEIRSAVTDIYNGVNLGLVIVGSTAAPDYPGTSRPFTDTLNPEGTDAFIARIGTAGTATDFSVIIGGQGTDVAQYIKRNPLNGDLWFAGTTISGSSVVGTTPSGTNSYNTFPATVNPGSTTQNTTRQVIGDDRPNASNFFVGRFTHFSDGSLTFGIDGDATNPRYATVFGTGLTNSSVITDSFGTAVSRSYITGFDISAKDDNSVQMAFSGVTDSALAPQTNALITPDGDVTSGYTYPNHHAGFLLRFAVSTSVTPTNAFSLSRTSSQYVVGTNDNELRGVALDGAGNAYVVGTVFQGTPVNVDTSTPQGSLNFYTTANAIADTNGTTVLGRILRSTDVFVRIYGTYGAYTGRNNILFSGLYGGNGFEEAGGVAESLSAGDQAGIPIYTGSAIAIDADANIYFTGTTQGSPNIPYTAGSFFHYIPPPGGELGSSDIFVARLSTGGKRLDYSTQLAASAGGVITSAGSGDSFFTSAMPAGIAVDSRGYVYITGNLRPSVIWPNTYTAGSTFEPTSSAASTIPVGQAANTIDTTYDVRPGSGPFPTTEGFLVTFNPTLSSLQFASYIGGTLDDLVYAPSLDSDGNAIVTGWTDGYRGYSPPFSTTFYQDFSGSLPGFISGNAVKTIPDTNGLFPIFNVGYNAFRNGNSARAADQQSIPMVFGRDGFVSRVNPNLPAVVPSTIALSFNPSSISALGTSTGTVTLNAAQPLSTRVTVYLSSLGTLAPSDITLQGPNDSPGQLTNVVIPSGQTTGTFTVKSNTVGKGGTLTFGAVLANGASSTSSLQIGGLSFGLGLSPSTVVGSSAGTTITGTITNSTAVTTAVNYLITVPNTPEARTIFNVGSGSAFATVDASDPTKLDVATATIPANSTSGTFTFKVGSPAAPTTLILTASTVASSSVTSLTSTASLTVNPVGLVSVTPTLRTLRGGRDQLVLNVVFDGPVSSSDAFQLAYSLGGVFPPTTSSSPTLNTTIGALSFVGVSNGQYTYRYTANSNRVTRSQDINIVATYKGTTASTSVTVVR